MKDPLAHLLADGVIDEVVARLKSGKEADLWLVRHRGDVIAAKVYKERQTRSFRNDAAYREGRKVRDSRTQRAMDRGSRFGRAAAEDAWKVKEADALHALHAAGVRVPRPVMFYEGVLLMELVLDAHGHPAPRLVDAHVRREDAAALYADLRGQAVRMLASDLVHGDLSPYNVLVGHGGPVVIDFPQVVGAAHNAQAESFFRRDVENLRRFFAAIDPALHAAAGDAREIWTAYVRRELTPDFVPSGRAEPARDGGGHHRADRHARAGGEGAPRRPEPGQGSPQRRPGPPRRDAPRRAEPPAATPAPTRSHGRGGRGRPAAPGPEVIRVARPPIPHAAPAHGRAAPHAAHAAGAVPHAKPRPAGPAPAAHHAPARPAPQPRTPAPAAAAHHAPAHPAPQPRPAAGPPASHGAPHARTGGVAPGDGATPPRRRRRRRRR
jgi:RIO kinase 1